MFVVSDEKETAAGANTWRRAVTGEREREREREIERELGFLLTIISICLFCQSNKKVR